MILPYRSIIHMKRKTKGLSVEVIARDSIVLRTKITLTPSYDGAVSSRNVKTLPSIINFVEIFKCWAKAPIWGLFISVYDWQQNTSYIQSSYFLHLSHEGQDILFSACLIKDDVYNVNCFSGISGTLGTRTNS